MAQARKIFLFLLFNIFAVLIILLLCEGLASVIILLQTSSTTPPVAERQHTQYDQELGWVSRPNLYIADMYGLDLYLQTNEQGFRNNQDFSPQLPPDKLRLICSGDSFTLGYGVDNDHTWCQLLAAMDDRLQTVNMGQGGYGIDQAYLWYKRDGLKLDHDIHLFSFITNDFARMQADQFLGYGKPLLRVEEDELVVDNVPVPRRAFYVPWLTQNSESIKKLRLVQLLSQFFQSGDEQSERAGLQPDPGVDSRLVADKIFEELQQYHQRRGSRLVLVYLPTLADYEQAPAETDQWRQDIEAASAEAGILFIDLVEEFWKLPPEQAYSLFIPPGASEFPGAAGHYSVAGNQYVAQLLYQHLFSSIEIDTVLENRGE